MILRVDIDSMAASIDLADTPWTPELVATFLRLLGEQVVDVYTRFMAPDDEEPDGPAVEA